MAPDHLSVAKVGVEGSNPFARSNFLQVNQRLRRVLPGLLLLPRLWHESRGKWGKQAKAKRSGLWVAFRTCSLFRLRLVTRTRRDRSGRARPQTSALDTSVRRRSWASRSIKSSIGVSILKPNLCIRSRRAIAGRLRGDGRGAASHVDGTIEVHCTVEIGGAAEGVGTGERLVGADARSVAIDQLPIAGGEIGGKGARCVGDDTDVEVVRFGDEVIYGVRRCRQPIAARRPLANEGDGAGAQSLGANTAVC
jgi:hypothetical protein